MIINRAIDYLRRLETVNRVNLALTRVAAASALREIDTTNPNSWEFSGFSQNGEDGIIDVLLGKARGCNHYFIEIGSSDGIECNTAFLPLAGARQFLTQ